MEIKYKIWIEENGKVIFGKGRYDTLKSIEGEYGLRRPNIWGCPTARHGKIKSHSREDGIETDWKQQQYEVYATNINCQNNKRKL